MNRTIQRLIQILTESFESAKLCWFKALIWTAIRLGTDLAQPGLLHDGRMGQTSLFNLGFRRAGLALCPLPSMNVATLCVWGGNLQVAMLKGFAGIKDMGWGYFKKKKEMG